MFLGFWGHLPKTSLKAYIQDRNFVKKSHKKSNDFTCNIWKSMVKYINNYLNNIQNIFFKNLREF